MKKKVVYSLIGVILVIVIILSIFTIKSEKISNDEKKFKSEYERFNGTKNLSGVSYLSVEVPEKNGVTYISTKKAAQILKNETGVIYFGYPESSWSRHILTSLFNAKESTGLDKIYYCNAYSERDEKSLKEDGSIEVIKDGSDSYYKIIEALGDKADSYQGLNDDSIKRLYFPTVVFVKNGKIVDIHVSTLPSHTKERKKLTEKQSKELEQIYEKAINKII